MDSTRQLQHLYWRAGFGPRPQDLTAGLSPRKALRQLLRDSEKFEPLQVAALPGSAEPTMAAPAPGAAPRSEQTPEQRKARRQAARDAYRSMSTAWMRRMAESPAQLREKMTLFWHGHFACRVSQRPEAALQLHNTMHRLALGKFPELLLAVSREPAMLQFLNNQQNRKQQPNENFARELMELFTLGRGHYSETDVKEAARAFTGWGYDDSGSFRFRARQHDDGLKTFLGHTGNLTGEDVLRILLEQPQVAVFLTTKIYRFFVNDQPSPASIEPLAAAFRQSGYDLADLLERLFSADWFYEPANIGTRIKSPVELLAGMRRSLGVRFEQEQPLLALQKALGQTLFMPPNVAGWPGGRSWIDSSSLLLRLQLPTVLFRNAAFAVALKDDDNDLSPNASLAERSIGAAPDARLALAPLQALLAGTPPEKQAGRLAGFLLQVPLRPEALALVQQQARAAAPPETLRNTLIGLLSLPEYQLA
ncbi:DUF1800 domain-containing protein [Hymenobacter saemangeumensis]|uniref:DUF1800 domain-containing protein n=1 Tax=Hymenobacter saemangeumensis TaxID=1084522 RepID=A0ABP8I3P0_9BACT